MTSIPSKKSYNKSHHQIKFNQTQYDFCKYDNMKPLIAITINAKHVAVI